MAIIETHNHWNDLIEWMHEHWPILSGMVATIIGGVWMILHKTFPTHDKLALCKSDLIDQLKKHEEWEQKQHERASDTNAAQHNEIYKELGYVRRDVGELKNLLIKLGDK